VFFFWGGKGRGRSGWGDFLIVAIKEKPNANCTKPFLGKKMFHFEPKKKSGMTIFTLVSSF